VRAYGMKDFQVEGPDWLRSERFDVAAKFPEALPTDREKYNAGLHAMLQNMLVDRFKLVVHHALRRHVHFNGSVRGFFGATKGPAARPARSRYDWPSGVL